MDAAPTDASVEGGLAAEPEAAAHSGADMAKLTPSSLPLETRCQPFPLRQLAGFWLPEFILPGVAAAHARFSPRPGDVFLASFPKSGTTWLKALAYAALHRARHPPSDPAHPLRAGSPHDCVSFFELPFALAAAGTGTGGPGAPPDADVFAAVPSPRVLATHLPYRLLPERVTAEGSGCRVVYVCRDPKDALVSAWLFTRKNLAAAGKGAAPPPAYPLEEAFMGCPFSGEEEAAGVVDAVVELCSLESLKGSKGNRSGGVTELNLDKGSFFRKGTAGDWRNHMTPAMAARLDAVVGGALQGSGFTFGGSVADTATPA